MNYFISDLHFGHANVIKFDNRPFKDVEEMNEKLIRNWNETVTKKDVIYILGDFIWGTNKQWLEIVPRLKGRKILIRGNHDLKKMPAQLKNMFEAVYNYKEIKEDGYRICMSHYPMLLYPGSHGDKTLMFCGHVHQTLENAFLEKWIKEIKESSVCGNHGNIYNVGCMMPWMDYRPRTREEILERAEAFR